MKTIIRSVYSSNDEIMKGILELFCPTGFDCDVTYSTGMFYKNIPSPRLKFDLFPQTPDTIAADVQALPIRSNFVQSIVFDPPFITGSKANGKDGIMKKRFGMYRTIKDLWRMYHNALVELYRVLKPGGILIFKCQDVVENHKNYFTHCQVEKDATETGFMPVDLFILTANQRPIQANLKTQVHARKFHSYFWIFKKPL